MGVLEAGKIYVIDVAPSSDNPDNYGAGDIGSHGTGHVVIDVPQRIIHNMSTKKEHGGDNDFPGGETMILAQGYWADKCSITGLIQGDTPTLTLAKQADWINYVGDEREDDDLYLVFCFEAGLYWRFYNPETDNTYQYSKGAFVDTDLTQKWVNNKDLIIQNTFIWKSNW